MCVWMKKKDKCVYVCWNREKKRTYLFRRYKERKEEKKMDNMDDLL
jgi:hypothetical protein